MKILYVLIFFCVHLLVATINIAIAQSNKNDMAFGISFVLSGMSIEDQIEDSFTEVSADGKVGIQANAYYHITPTIRIVGDFTNFFLSDVNLKKVRQNHLEVNEDFRYDFRTQQLNLNVHWLILNDFRGAIYFLAGIGRDRYLFEELVSRNGSIIISADTIYEIGGNLGLGLELRYKFIDLYGEYINTFQVSRLSVGLRFPF